MFQKFDDEQIEEAINIFINGCQNPKCLSMHCKNYIEENVEIDSQRKTIELAQKFILKQIQKNSLQIFCMKKFQINPDFIQIFNQTNEEQTESLKKIKELLKDKEYQKYFIDSYVYLFQSLKNIRKMTPELFIFVIRVIINFDEILENSYEKLQQYMGIQNLTKFIIQEKIDLQFQDIKLIENFIDQLLNYIVVLKETQKNFLFNLQQSNALRTYLNLLKFLYDLNDVLKLKIPKSSFQIKSFLPQKIINIEIIKFVLKKAENKQISHPFNGLGFQIMMYQNNLYFFFYPCLFSTIKKHQILKKETALMQKILEDKMQQIINLNFGFAQLFTEEIYFEIRVKRTQIFEDTMENLKVIKDEQNFLKLFKIQFIGEIGEDQGGLKKEFFQLIFKAIEEKDLFVSKNNLVLWFNKKTTNDYYYEIGLLIGIAITCNIQLDLKFPDVFYKLLIRNFTEEFWKKQIYLNDIKELEPEIYKTLLKIQNENIEEQEHPLYFEISYQEEELKNHELIENGAQIQINEQNKNLFIQKYIEWILFDKVEEKINQLILGFQIASHQGVISIFDQEDLKLSLLGNENQFDFKELKKYTKYQGYDQNEKFIEDFWKILVELNLDHKKKFLKFLTGSDRIPIEGFKAINFKIFKSGDSSKLPSVSTCSNILFLPKCEQKEVLKEKLIMAIEGSEGFDFIQIIYKNLQIKNYF